MTTLEQLQAAQSAKNVLASADTQWKNNALFAMADSLETAQEDILAANQKDLSAAKGVISEVMLGSFGVVLSTYPRYGSGNPCGG